MSSPNRLAFVITELDPGGAERALVQIVTRLATMGWQPKVFCLSGPGEMVAPLEAADIPVACLGATSGRSLSVLAALRRGLRDWQPNLVQTFLFHANIAGRLAATVAGRPVVVSGLRVAERDAPWRMRFDRWTQSLVSMNVAVSQGVADFVVNDCGFSAGKITVIPNGVDVERFSQASPSDLTAFGIPAGARVLTFIGRLHPQKGPDLLLNAVLPKLLEDPELHLLLVGEGPMRGELEQMAQNSPSARQVHFVGRQPDTAGLLKASTGLLVPSRWEGMPNVVLEGLAAGCPIVATDVEGISEVLGNWEFGWICPARDVEAFRRGIEALLNRTSDGQPLCKSPHPVTQQTLTWEKIAEYYDNLYRSLIPLRGTC